MPRRRVVEDDDDDDADYRGTQTQATQQTQSTTTTTLTAAELEKKAKEVVKYLLLMEVKKVAVRKSDISKHVMKENGRQINAVLDKATQELHDVFGLSLVQVDRKTKTYALVSELDPEARAAHRYTERDLEKMALLMPILGECFGFIFCIAYVY